MTSYYRGGHLAFHSLFRATEQRSHGRHHLSAPRSDVQSCRREVTQHVKSVHVVDLISMSVAVPAPHQRLVLPCLQVLTDLINEWHAMWLDGSTIYQHTFTSQNRAVGFIDDLLAGRFETCRDISQTSFANRRQMDDRLCVSCARNALFAQQVQALSTHSIGLVSRGSFETSGRCVHACWGRSSTMFAR